MKCYKCDYEWEYKGSSIYHISCPRCSYKLMLSKVKRLENDEKLK